MRQTIFIALSIIVLPLIVNAEVATINQVVETALSVGEDEVRFKDKSATLLGYKAKTGIPSRGAGVGPRSTPDGSARGCFVAIKETKKGKQPECLIFHWYKNYPEEKNYVEYAFRFSLDGKLEKAFRSTGKLTDTGEGVEGSAVDTPLKVKDFEVQQRAREMLDFWRQRTAKYLAEKRGQPTVTHDAVAEPAAQPAETTTP